MIGLVELCVIIVVVNVYCEEECKYLFEWVIIMLGVSYDFGIFVMCLCLCVVIIEDFELC